MSNVPNDASRGAADRARFAAALRGLTGKRQAQCRCTRVAATVQLVEAQHRTTGERRVVARGVSTCGSGHSCPTCAGRIAAVRGEELCAALEAHGRDRTMLATLTLRHRAGMALRPLRRLLSLAASEMWAGRAGMALRARIGLLGRVSSNEQTHGANGWHPHQHQAWFLEAAPTQEQLHWCEVEKKWLGEWQREISMRWAQCVERAYVRIATAIGDAKMGEDTAVFRRRLAKLWGTSYVKSGSLLGCALAFERDWRTLGRLEGLLPSFEHGADLVPVLRSKTYLTKLGLEITGIAGKAGKVGHETHWQVYRRAAAGDRRARRLVREHYQAMRGSALLVWSPGLRKALGLRPERPDGDVAAEAPEPVEDVRLLREYSAEEWDAGASARGQLWLAGLLELHAHGTLEQTSLAQPFGNLAWQPEATRAPPVRPHTWEFKVGRQVMRPPMARPKAEPTWFDSLTRCEQIEELRHTMRFDHGVPVL